MGYTGMWACSCVIWYCEGAVQIVPGRPLEADGAGTSYSIGALASRRSGGTCLVGVHVSSFRIKQGTAVMCGWVGVADGRWT